MDNSKFDEFIRWLERSGLPAGWVLLGAVGVLVVLVVVVAVYVRKRRLKTQREAFESVRKRFDMQPLSDEGALDEIKAYIEAMFPEARMYQQYLEIRRAYSAQIDRLDVSVIHGVFVNAPNVASFIFLNKMFVIVRGFAEPLPEFKISPSNFILRYVYKNDSAVSQHTPFGRNNVVTGPDLDSIRERMSTQVQRALKTNRNMAMKAKDDFAAFYAHDMKVVPKSPVKFVQTAVDIAQGF